MINNKVWILIIILIFAIVGIVAFTMSNNTNNNENITNDNNDTVAKNNSITISNSTKNDTSVGKLYSFKKNNSKNQKNIKNPKFKLISKNEAIKQVKLNLKNQGKDYIDIGNAKLVKNDGKQYWAVDYIESGGRPVIMYIDARAN